MVTVLSHVVLNGLARKLREGCYKPGTRLIVSAVFLTGIIWCWPISLLLEVL